MINHVINKKVVNTAVRDVRDAKLSGPASSLGCDIQPPPWLPLLRHRAVWPSWNVTSGLSCTPG